MSETLKRVLVAIGILIVVCVAGILEHLGIQAIRWLGVFVGIGMIYEMLNCLFHAKHTDVMKNLFWFMMFLALLVLLVVSVYFVGTRVRNMLLLFVIICSADRLTAKPPTGLLRKILTFHVLPYWDLRHY